MKAFSVVIERCSETGLLADHVPGFAGAHSQGETDDELLVSLKEVVNMLLDGGPVFELQGQHGRATRRQQGTGLLHV